MAVFVLMADGEVDQIVETREIANREKGDLVKMGCVVRIREFPNWEAAEAFQAKEEGRWL